MLIQTNIVSLPSEQNVNLRTYAMSISVIVSTLRIMLAFEIGDMSKYKKKGIRMQLVLTQDDKSVKESAR